jgi:hypothetical protein
VTTRQPQGRTISPTDCRWHGSGQGFESLSSTNRVFTRTLCSLARGCLSLGMAVAGELRDGECRRPADGRFVGNPP